MASDDARSPIDTVGRAVGRAVAPTAAEVVQTIDVDALLADVDPDELLARVDVDRLLARVDVDRLLERVDVDRLLERVDPNLLVADLDLDALLAEVDLEQLAENVDLRRLVRETGVAEVVAEEANGMVGDAVDHVRRQLLSLDEIVTSGARRMLRRGDTVSASGEAEGDVAGVLTRLVSLAVDLTAATTVFTAFAAALVFVVRIVFGVDFEGGGTFGLACAGVLGLWIFGWHAASLSALGRTPGMFVTGCKVTALDGSLGFRQALWRTLLQGAGTIGFGVTYLPLLLASERTTLHDRVAGTTLVHAWGGDGADIASPLASFLADRDAGPKSD